MFKEVDPKQSFPRLEEEILGFWEDNFIFKKSVSQRSKEKEYTFYDGPPFATGLPHYGHILAGTIKDVIPRFFAMCGYKIERRFGWDCHGLPVENEVEKELGLKSKKDIECMGVSKFNETCRSIVLKYVGEWEKIVNRMGRWVDFKNDYKTMDARYMETIWWVFKQLWDKGYIYEGHKSMHICPRCETPLSNFEVTQGYKDTVDQSVIAKFKLKDEADTYILAWTTTPWTLPGNVALAVSEDIAYVKIKDGDEYYILAKPLLVSVYGEDDLSRIEVIEELQGKILKDRRYYPLFDYYTDRKDIENIGNAYKVITAGFVSTEDGTGVVHIAPAFGEDDMNAGKENGLPFLKHVDIDGTFNEDVKDFVGKDVKKSDTDIIRFLRDKNLLFSTKSFKHSYPHCWRCDTPLLNYSTNSWFVNIEKIKTAMLKSNLGINWVPDHLKSGRFGKWLENARDWAISRNRYWGAPIPVWRDDHDEMVCIGSMGELKASAGDRVSEIILVRHGESLGNINCLRQCKGEGSSLTDTGRKQAQKCGLLIAGMNKVDKMFVSPLRRTRETADAIKDKLGIDYEVREELREIDFGVNDNKTSKELKDYIEYRKSLSSEERFNQKIDNNCGESQYDVGVRMNEFIMGYIKKHPGQTIVIVSHSDPIKFFEREFLGLPLEKAYSIGHKPYATPLMLYYDHKTGKPLDLHKHLIDDIEIVSKTGKKMYRVPEVLDCWFESGAMPYAQVHYPFENKEWFESNFPANFIAEGLDQTRGWFYTLVVLSSALFGKPPFRNVVVNGIVLAEDGKKMSKRLKNYPAPSEILDTYGADAMRYYLMSSHVVRAEDTRFSEKGVKDVVKNIILPIWNVYGFFVTYSNIDSWRITELPSLTNSLDRFIVSRLNTLLEDTTKYYNEYDIQKSVNGIPEFIDDLTNWYIRRSRRRFWKSENDTDKSEAYATLYYVLKELSKIIAPVMPFIAESIYRNLTKETESVHLSDWSEISHELIDKELEKEVSIIRTIVNLGHSIRAKSRIKVRQPLSSVQIGLPDSIPKELIKREINIIKEELNVKSVSIIEDTSSIAKIKVFPDAKIIGPKYGKDTQYIINSAKAGDFVIKDDNSVVVSSVIDGMEKEYILTKEEVKVGYEGKEGFNVESSNGIVIALDISITKELETEGKARDLVRIIQDMRKEADFNVANRIIISLKGADNDLLDSCSSYIKKETLCNDIKEDLEYFDIEKSFGEIVIKIKRDI